LIDKHDVDPLANVAQTHATANNSITPKRLNCVRTFSSSRFFLALPLPLYYLSEKAFGDNVMFR
jgi:hypothetical protein